MIEVELVRYFERIPGLPDALSTIVHNIYRYGSENDLVEINPETFVSPTGKVVIELEPPAPIGP
jgi:hypothetical protein